MLKISLDENTRSILYNEDPYDDISYLEILDFTNEVKKIYMMARWLLDKIILRDNKICDNPETEYNSDNYAVNIDDSTLNYDVQDYHEAAAFADNTLNRIIEFKAFIEYQNF